MTERGGRDYPYQEVAQTLRRAISDGQLGVGDKLPSVRQLAREHGVTPTTAARAVRALTDAGYVTTVAGLGIYVTDSTDPAAHEVTAGELVAQLDQIQLAVSELADRVTRLESPRALAAPGHRRGRTTA